MGRYYYSKKQVANQLKSFDVFFLKKHKYLGNIPRWGAINWSRNGESTGDISISTEVEGDALFLRLNYTQTNRSTGEKKDFDYKVELITVPCYFGGSRYYFVCPWYVNNIYCGRRVAKLYKGGDYFACRHCYNLSYNSRNENRKGVYGTLGKMFNAEAKIEKLREKIRRRTYKGLPTKNMRKLNYLQKIVDFGGNLDIDELLYRSK
jgi:Zn-finger protein